MGSQAFMDPCSPLALTPEGSVNSVSTGPLALTPSPLPARLPVLDQSAKLDQTRHVLRPYLCTQPALCCLCKETSTDGLAMCPSHSVQAVVGLHLWPLEGLLLPHEVFECCACVCSSTALHEIDIKEKE